MPKQARSAGRGAASDISLDEAEAEENLKNNSRRFDSDLTLLGRGRYMVFPALTAVLFRC
jgi:hypothetical protein